MLPSYQRMVRQHLDLSARMEEWAMQKVCKLVHPEDSAKVHDASVSCYRYPPEGTFVVHKFAPPRRQ